MAISVNWITGVIFVPKADMTLITMSPYEFRELDSDAFRLILRDLEDNPDGRPWPPTHVHETESTISGIVYARKIRIIPPYTVTFEDGQYAVNIIGSNNNILDVNNKNQVSVNPSNSAGLQNPNLAADVWNALLSQYQNPGSMGEAQNQSLESVWNALLANYQNPGSTGEALKKAAEGGENSNPWSVRIVGNQKPGTFGELVGKKLAVLIDWLSRGGGRR